MNVFVVVIRGWWWDDGLLDRLRQRTLVLWRILLIPQSPPDWPRNPALPPTSETPTDPGVRPPPLNSSAILTNLGLATQAPESRPFLVVSA